MCCKKIKDILNVLGKDVRYVSYDATDIPIVNKAREVSVNWAGERLIATYTQVLTVRGRGTQITPHKVVLTNNTPVDLSLPDYHPNPGGFINTTKNTVWFKCINVTYLEVNGEILINI